VTDADRKPFADLLSQALAFYRQDVSEFTLSVWWAGCQPFSLDQVRKALTAHALDAERGQFAPKPADLVRQLDGTRTDRSLMAWSKVFDTMRSIGAYRSVAFDDPAIHAAITDLGGWPTVCRSEIAELPFLQKRFCDSHRAYTARSVVLEAPTYLPGEFDAQNAIAGHESAPPVAVRSDAARAAIGTEQRRLA
jgi:hypothetical protein